MNWKELPFINKVKLNVEAFGRKVIALSNTLGFHPSWLMIVMNNESGLDPKAKNPNSSATGLIQFMEETAKSLGTSTAELKAMSNVKQLDYVLKYLKPYSAKVNTLADLYLAVFYPLSLYRTDDFVFPEWAVRANKIFDINKDGVLTKREFRQYVANKYSSLNIPFEKKNSIQPVEVKYCSHCSQVLPQV